MPAQLPKLGFWLTDSSVPTAEIVAGHGFGFVVLDIEHGMFDLAILERHIPLLKGLGLEVFAKVLGPTQEAIQQALDFGADGVVIPHTKGLAQTASITGFAKFPPLGERSIAGGRPFNYGYWAEEQLDVMNKNTLCFPLVEHPAAVEDIEEIAKLPTVDGFMVGPGDLAAISGHGSYRASDDDFALFERCVDAFERAGKTWIFPAWTEAEQMWAIQRGCPRILINAQYSAFGSAVAKTKGAFDAVVVLSRSGALN